MALKHPELDRSVCRHTAPAAESAANWPLPVSLAAGAIFRCATAT